MSLPLLTRLRQEPRVRAGHERRKERAEDKRSQRGSVAAALGVVSALMLVGAAFINVVLKDDDKPEVTPTSSPTPYMSASESAQPGYEWQAPAPGPVGLKEKVRIKLAAPLQKGQTLWIFGQKQEDGVPYFPNSGPVFVDEKLIGTDDIVVGVASERNKEYKFFVVLLTDAQVIEVQDYWRTAARLKYPGMTRLPGKLLASVDLYR